MLSYDFNYMWVLSSLVKLLEDNRASIEQDLKDRQYLLDDESVAIYLGHRELLPGSPAISVFPKTITYQWGAIAAYDYEIGATLLLQIKMMDRAVRDMYLGWFESAVRKVVLGVGNLTLPVYDDDGNQVGTCYDSFLRSGQVGTLDQGSTYAIALDWWGKVWTVWSP